MTDDGARAEAADTSNEGDKGTIRDDDSGTEMQIDQISAMMSDFTGEEDVEDGNKKKKKDSSKDISEAGDSVREIDDDDEEDIKNTVDNKSADKKGDKQADKDTSELDQLKAEIAELKGVITSLKDGKVPDKKGEDGEVDNAQLAKTVEDIQKDLTAEYVASDEEFDKIIEDRGNMNALLRKVQADAIQGLLRIFPKIVTGMVTQQTVLVQKTAEFYAKNSDLKKHGKEVGRIIDEAHSQHPDWSLDKVLEFVGGDGNTDIGEVRRQLKLERKAEKKANDSDEQQRHRPPNTDRAAHSRKLGDKTLTLTGIEKEIGDMLNETE